MTEHAHDEAEGHDASHTHGTPHAVGHSHGTAHPAGHTHPHVVEPVHAHEPEPVEPGSSITAYAAIKYTAIIIIVLAILYFLAVYVIPRLT